MMLKLFKKEEKMSYSIWKGSIKIASYDDFDTALHRATILQRQESVKIMRDNDKYIWSWNTQRFFSPVSV